MQKVQTDASDVCGLQLPALSIRRLIPAKLSVDGAGHDVAYLYAVMANLLHQGFAETVEAEFRGIVSRHTRMRIRTGKRRDVDDITAATLLHEWYSLMAAIEHAEEIRFQHGAKIFRRDFFDRSEDANPCVVD